MDEWWAAKPAYFKRINFPFDQRAGLLVCGIGLTAQMRRGWTDGQQAEGKGSREGVNSNGLAESFPGESPFAGQLVVCETARRAREHAINRQRTVKARKTLRIFRRRSSP